MISHIFRTSRDVKRIEGLAQSPVLCQFSESMNGRVSVNAFGIRDFMLKKYYEAQNFHGAAWITWVQLTRWLQFRLDNVTVRIYDQFNYAAAGCCKYAAKNVHTHFTTNKIILIRLKRRSQFQLSFYCITRLKKYN